MADFTVTVEDGESEADGGAPKAQDVFAKVKGPVRDEAHADGDGGTAANGRDQALIASDGGADSIDAGKENAETADDGA